MGNCTHFTSPEPTFSTNGVPNPDQSGLDLEAGAGIELTNVGDEVTIAATAGPGPNFADDEVPSGTIDGANVTFILAHTPSPAESLELIQSSRTLKQGIGYTLSGVTITMSTAPLVGDVLYCWYRY